MRRKEYVWYFCVLQFLVVVDVNVNALSLASCENPIEYELCQLICTTPDISQTVAFYKLPNTGTIIAQCIPSLGCFGSSQYNISQPSSSSTVLSFNHSRQESSDWRCDYGSSDVSVSVTWATFPQAVSTTLTSTTTIDTSIDVNVTLECLHSQSSPTVTLQYEDESGDIHETSAGPFQCIDTAVVCTDAEFKTYSCSVTIKAESGMDYSDVYSIQVKTKVANVLTEDIQTIATGISFQRTPITTEQQTTTHETTTDETTTHETTTDETTTMKTNEVSKYSLKTIIIGIVLGVCVLSGIIILIVFVIKRRKQRNITKTPKQDISNGTYTDPPANMAMQHR